MKKTVTKRSLLTSVMSLFLCFAMLLGTTYAWFTDTASSKGNKVQAGTLDVELLMWNGTEYVNISEQEAPIFGTAETALNSTNTLWEPGKTQVAYLAIANEGNLDLKYAVALDVYGVTQNLNEVMEFAITPDAQATDAQAPVWAGGETAKVGLQTVSAPSTKLAKDETHYFALSIHMMEEAGNEYKGGEISFDLTVYATQIDSENDSYGNKYDAEAAWLGHIPASLAETSLEIVPTLGAQTGTITVHTPEDLVYLNKLTQEWVSLYSNGQGTNVGSYRENVGGKGTDYYYYWTWDIELAADLDMNNFPMDSINIGFWDNFNGNGHTISNVVMKNGQNGLFSNDVSLIENLTVENITVNAPRVNKVGAVANQAAMTNVHVVNATVTGGKYVGGICGKGSGFINCSIKDSVIVASDKTVGGLVGYSIGDPGAATVSGNTVENVTVIGAYNVGGLLGQAQNGTIEGNTVKNVAVKSTAQLPANASSNEVLTAELAARSAFADTTIGVNTIENVTKDSVVSIQTADDLVAAFANLNAGDVLYIAADIDMTGKTVTPVTGNKGFTMLGNGHTISNLHHTGTTESGLFVVHSGSAVYKFYGVVLENCSVKSTQLSSDFASSALFVGNADTSDEIIISDCHVKNCTVESEKYAAAFVGYTAGWNVVNDGPVYSDVLIENCSVIGGSITGKGSAGVAVGHSSGNDDTTTTITNLTVDGVAINGEDAAHTGIVVGTAHIGDTVINKVTYQNVTGNYNPATVLYGRFVPGTTGALEINGTSLLAGNTTADLTNAINSGKTDVYLPAGTYTLPGVNNGELNISGTKDTEIKITTPAFHGSDVILNGVTVLGQGDFTGIQHVQTVTYNNVTVKGTMFLYGEKVVFNNCTFELNNQYIWTYGAKEVEFNNCTFNTNGKALYVYANGIETANNHQTVKITDCKFYDTGDNNTQKAAIETGDDYYKHSYDIIMTNTTVTGFAVTEDKTSTINYGGSNFGTNVWGNKYLMGTDKLNVVIDGVDVY